MTVLELLEEDRILDIYKNKDGDFVFTEACDGYFSVTLKKDQVLSLAEELRKLVEE